MINNVPNDKQSSTNNKVAAKGLVVILGPTGVGKTELTLRLAEYFNTSIINADSRQIFAEIPIGTAAPTPDQLKKIKQPFKSYVWRLNDVHRCCL